MQTIIHAGPHRDERKQLASAYVGRELHWKNEKSKGPVRDKIVEHILRYHEYDRMRYFGFPGLHWMTERALILQAACRVDTLGVERNCTLLDSSLPYMPGRNRGRYEEHLASRVFYGARSSRAKLLWCRCGDLMTICKKDHAIKGDRKKFNSRWKRWTAFWLDFNGPLDGEIERCLQRAEQWLDMRCHVVPFAISVLHGRERSMVDIEAAGSREKLIAAILDSRKYRATTVDDAWEYKSSGSTMLTICGRMAL